MKKPTCVAIAVAIAAAGCATSSKNVATSYVSPLQYQNYDCEQLGAESSRIHARASQLAGRLDEAASNDKAIAGVGMILFWPALFALGGTKGQEAEYGRLKGEYEAVHQASIQKKCGLQIAPIAPPEKPADTDASEPSDPASVTSARWP